MQFRRNLMSPVFALLLAGVAASLVGTARADVRHEDTGANALMLKQRASVHRLHTTNTTPGDPDTTWIGHVFGSTGLPGDAGGYGPFHIGRGGYRPHYAGLPGPATTPANGSTITYTNAQANNGYWDFDRFNPGETDTLQGWWPMVTPFQSTGSSNKPDRQRPFSGFDYGNAGNYRGNDTQKSTFGVISYWHVDNGQAASIPNTIPGTNPVSPNWTPLSGNKSLWCGLRGHGDQSAIDPITNQAVNCDVIARNGDNHFIQFDANSPNGTDANFPGYGSQWDQMSFKDFSHTTGQPINLSFKYTTHMSTGFQTGTPTRVGWFDKDPLLTVTQNDGNFISSSDAVNQGPIDSFMVYVGVPVNDAACAFTNTLVPNVTFKPVWDPLRRWFSEVLRIDQPYYEVLTTFGTTGSMQTPSISIPPSYADALGPNFRVVFRIKTNRGSDDEDSYVSTFSSGGNGAAIIDDVNVNGAVTDFETAGQVDNNAATTAAWHTTGKPPGMWFHWHNLQAGSPGGYVNGLPYFDPCGALGGSSRLCDLIGNIITDGDHDAAGERSGGAPGSNNEDREQWFMSPTINLLASGNGAGNYNGMGIDQDIAFVSSDYWLACDVYQNLLWTEQTGHGCRIGWQTYPGTQPNGSLSWSTPVKTIFFSDVAGVTGCFSGLNGEGGFEGAFANASGAIVNYSGRAVPDSMRAFIEELTTCFRRPLTVDCNPATTVYANAYFDNMSLGFIDGGQPPGLSESISDNLQDAFPNNSDNSFLAAGFEGGSFDTLAALVRSGENRALQTGNLQRGSIPGDSMVVIVPGNNVRVDLIFRILPGPGNYFGVVPTGAQKIGFLKTRPDQNVQATPDDGTFWGSYLFDIGPFGSGGIYGSARKPMGDFTGDVNKWSPNIWCSARADTAEGNLFPCPPVIGTDSRYVLTPGTYISTYHESELQANWTPALRNGSVAPFTAAPNRGKFISPHYRCILINTTTGSALDETNENCRNTDLGDVVATYDNKWKDPTTGPGGGYLVNLTSGTYTDPTTFPAGTINAGEVGSTKELTKIIPDGQLTAGAHVEYFWRKTLDGNFVAPGELLPDTTLIFPNTDAGGDFDGNRWQHMSVLPDMWKSTNFGGTGMACMLVVNMDNRRGEMITFDNVAQTLGLMSSAKRGAAAGFYIGATQNYPADITGLTAGELVSLNLGQKGTVYDVYNVQGGESNTMAGRLGSRYAGGGLGRAANKTSTEGPTKLMLKQYRHLFFLATDGAGGTSGGFGPVTDQTDDEVSPTGIVTDFLTDGTVGSTTPRTAILIGRDIARGLHTDFPSFTPTYFGANYRNDDYRGLSGVADDVPDLIPAAPIAAGGIYSGAIYGVFSPCTLKNDVLNVNTAVTGATAAATYENLGAGGPYVSMVYAPSGGSRVANTLEGGWIFGTFGGQGSRYTLSRGGQHVFWLNALTGAIGTVCGQTLSAPTGVGDGFNSGAKFVNFMNLRSENPMRSGEARIAFGITKTEKVEVKVYDVTGRLVKTVANQVFAGGQEHVVRWDGTDNQGQLVARGVYFYQLRSPSFVSEKKLTVLKD